MLLAAARAARGRCVSLDALVGVLGRGQGVPGLTGGSSWPSPSWAPMLCRAPHPARCRAVPGPAAATSAGRTSQGISATRPRSRPTRCCCSSSRARGTQGQQSGGGGGGWAPASAGTRWVAACTQRAAGQSGTPVRDDPRCHHCCHLYRRFRPRRLRLSLGARLTPAPRACRHGHCSRWLF